MISQWLGYLPLTTGQKIRMFQRNEHGDRSCHWRRVSSLVQCLSLARFILVWKAPPPPVTSWLKIRFPPMQWWCGSNLVAFGGQPLASSAHHLNISMEVVSQHSFVILPLQHVMQPVNYCILLAFVEHQHMLPRWLCHLEFFSQVSLLNLAGWNENNPHCMGGLCPRWIRSGIYHGRG